MLVDYAPILENEQVRLSPLSLDNCKMLIPVASQERLAQYSPSDIYTPESLINYVKIALE